MLLHPSKLWSCHHDQIIFSSLSLVPGFYLQNLVKAVDLQNSTCIISKPFQRLHRLPGWIHADVARAIACLPGPLVTQIPEGLAVGS